MKDMIQLLTEAFEMEYNDVFMYLHESRLFRQKLIHGERLGQLFYELSTDELQHADAITTKLIDLGEQPVWSFRLYTENSSLHEVLAHHHTREAHMLHLYQKLVENCTDRRFKLVLKGILRDEHAHMERITQVRNKLKRKRLVGS